MTSLPLVGLECRLRSCRSSRPSAFLLSRLDLASILALSSSLNRAPRLRLGNTIELESSICTNVFIQDLVKRNLRTSMYFRHRRRVHMVQEAWRGEQGKWQEDSNCVSNSRHLIYQEGEVPWTPPEFIISVILHAGKRRSAQRLVVKSYFLAKAAIEEEMN
ncbi:hypothetical protein SEMRO_438_G142951.1 [Seminavis robusta]|uniref:Uncharacterized protein n=1 Tax=Seminavis robusta TaxID=568900 RepID=A0A9N8HD12_9STRA|nr:hypothetical protein SEMRO_438_G142951.1 [Seminavis robusta]|eukprot:Sro438_g142951.1  (161) ;mRNA; f:7611-8093